MKKFQPRQSLGSSDFDDDAPAVSEASPRTRDALVRIFKDVAKKRKPEPGRRLTHEELKSGKY